MFRLSWLDALPRLLVSRTDVRSSSVPPSAKLSSWIPPDSVPRLRAIASASCKAVARPIPPAPPVSSAAVGCPPGGAPGTGRDPRVLPRVVIYDPELSLALPLRGSYGLGLAAIALVVLGLCLGLQCMVIHAARAMAEATSALPGEHSFRAFAKAGIEFQSLFGRKLQPIDCQNLFCEISKYARVVHPDVRGLSGRTRIKQVYRKSLGPMPQPTFPPKWNLVVPAIRNSKEKPINDLVGYMV